jgi:hypothetical protein
LRVVADALALSQFAVRHEVELIVVFGKPDGRVDGDATFAEGREADVTLAVDFGGDGCHADIVNSGRPFSGAGFEEGRASGTVTRRGHCNRSLGIGRENCEENPK